METIIKPIEITRENFAAYGDLISTDAIKPMDINADWQLFSLVFLLQ